jgi:hypothetical protein
MLLEAPQLTGQAGEGAAQSRILRYREGLLKAEAEEVPSWEVVEGALPH